MTLQLWNMYSDKSEQTANQGLLFLLKCLEEVGVCFLCMETHHDRSSANVVKPVVSGHPQDPRKIVQLIEVATNNTGLFFRM